MRISPLTESKNAAMGKATTRHALQIECSARSTTVPRPEARRGPLAGIRIVTIGTLWIALRTLTGVHGRQRCLEAD
jgi:hypothetical protein